MVFLHLQPYKKSSLEDKGNQTLTPYITSPYTVLQNIGYVAYKLALSPSRIQHVIGTNISTQIFYQNGIMKDPTFMSWRPSSISTLVNFSLGPSHRSSIQWHKMQPEDATWEPLLQIQQRFPHLKL